MRTLFYRNSRLLILFILVVFLWGFAAYQGLPRLEDPELTPRNASVQTLFPGASAEQIETLVTEKIETELETITEIKTYESSSQAGVSSIGIELQEYVSMQQVDGVWSRVRDKLKDAALNLPTGASEPDLEEAEVRAFSLLVSLQWKQPDAANYAILRRKAEALDAALSGLPGTESTELFGAPQEEIAVEVDLAQLSTLGLTAQQLATQIQNSDVKAPAGQLRGDNEFVVETQNALDSLEQIRQIPIRCETCTTAGQFAQVGDVAQVTKGIVEPPSSLALVSGYPAIVIGAYAESDYRLDFWQAAAQATLTDFEAQLPSDIGLQVVFDQNRYVSERLNSLLWNLVLGAGLLFLVSIFMLGLQAALVVELVLLLSVFIVFGMMGLLQIPLHQMSVTGLIVSLGLLIDNAIIVVDDMRVRLRRHRRPVAAVEESVRYLAAPLTAGTLTTVLTFMPIALLSGDIGEFISTLGINVVLGVLASLALALTITPVLVSRLQSTGRWGAQGFHNDKLSAAYRKTLRWTFRRPLVGVLLAVLLPISGFVALTTLDLQFFPMADRDQMQIQVEMPLSSSLAQTQATVDSMRDRLITSEAISDVHWFLGESSPRIYYNQLGGRDNAASFASGIIQLTQPVSPAWIREKQAELDSAFPQSRIILRWLEQGPPFEAPIELRIYGPDIEVLRSLGEAVRSLMVTMPEVTHTRAYLNESAPLLALQIDTATARSLNINPAQVSEQLHATLEGIEGGAVFEGSEELPIKVRLPNAERASLDQLSAFSVQSSAPTAADGPAESTPLDAIANLSLEPGATAITRKDGRRVNTVQGFIQAGVLPDTVLSEFQLRLDEALSLPPGYTVNFGGEVEERSAAIGALLASVGVLLVLFITTLVLSLGSFRLAAIILSIAPLSVGLAFLAEWIWGFPLGFTPIIGTLGLIGVSVNDSITVLTALKSDARARQGDLAAVQKVVHHATRHVLATTLTTMLGFVPLVLGGGGFWPPLAIAISGGVAGATVLALYFVPSAYLLLIRAKKKKTPSPVAAFSSS